MDEKGLCFHARENSRDHTLSSTPTNVAPGPPDPRTPGPPAGGPTRPVAGVGGGGRPPAPTRRSEKAKAKAEDAEWAEDVG
jgi:hypothetical protein